MSKIMMLVNKAFDVCNEKYYLSPEYENRFRYSFKISPARSDILLDISFTTSTGNSIVIKPNEVIYVPSPYKYVKYISSERTKTVISANITANKLCKDKFHLIIEYKIQYNLEFFDKNHMPIPFYVLQDNNPTPSYSLQAYSIYTKHVYLCGGSVNNLVSEYSSESETYYCSELPKYYIKAASSLLKLSLAPISKLSYNKYVNKNKELLDPRGVCVVSPILKLITSISIYRKALVEIK